MPGDGRPDPRRDDLAALQRRMVGAVHGDAEAFRAVAAGLCDSRLPADKRLFLHLNTVTHALTGVLREAYPATARQLGAERFEAQAKAFLRAEPPSAAVLSRYGAGFERFLAAASRLPEGTAALARLDWAAHEAYFAADAAVLAAAELAALPEAAHAGLRLPLVPSARLLPLPAPAAWARWSALSGEAVVVLPGAGPEGRGAAGAAVWRRPDLRVATLPLSGAELLCLAALEAGEPLLAAAEAAAPAAEPLDLAALLTAGLAGGLFRASEVPCRLDGQRGNPP